MRVTVLVVMEQRKLARPPVHAFLRELEAAGAGAAAIPLEDFVRRDERLLRLPLDPGARHVLLHRPGPLLQRADAAELCAFYRRFVATLPNLRRDLYDPPEAVQIVTASRRALREALLADPLLAARVPVCDWVAEDPGQRDALRVGGAPVLTAAGYRAAAHARALAGAAATALVALKPAAASGAPAAHLVHVVRVPRAPGGATVGAEYVCEPFLAAEHLYKVYALAGAPLLVRKARHRLPAAGDYYCFDSQGGAACDRAEALPLAPAEAAEVAGLARALAARLRLAWLGVDLLRGPAGRLLVVDVNHCTLPQPGDGLARALLAPE